MQGPERPQDSSREPPAEPSPEPTCWEDLEAVPELPFLKRKLLITQPFRLYDGPGPRATARPVTDVPALYYVRRTEGQRTELADHRGRTVGWMYAVESGCYNWNSRLVLHTPHAIPLYASSQDAARGTNPIRLETDTAGAAFPVLFSGGETLQVGPPFGCTLRNPPNFPLFVGDNVAAHGQSQWQIGVLASEPELQQANATFEFLARAQRTNNLDRRIQQLDVVLERGAIAEWRLITGERSRELSASDLPGICAGSEGIGARTYFTHLNTNEHENQRGGTLLSYSADSGSYGSLLHRPRETATEFQPRIAILNGPDAAHAPFVYTIHEPGSRVREFIFLPLSTFR